MKTSNTEHRTSNIEGPEPKRPLQGRKFYGADVVWSKERQGFYRVKRQPAGTALKDGNGTDYIVRPDGSLLNVRKAWKKEQKRLAKQ